MVLTDYIEKKIVVVYNTQRFKEFQQKHGSSYLVLEFDLVKYKNNILRYNEPSTLLESSQNNNQHFWI